MAGGDADTGVVDDVGDALLGGGHLLVGLGEIALGIVGVGAGDSIGIDGRGGFAA